MKTVIFDMDGVIVDSQYQWHQLEHHFLDDLLPDWEKTAKILFPSPS